MESDKEKLERLYLKYPQLRDIRVDKSLPIEEQKRQWAERLDVVQQAVDKEKAASKLWEEEEMRTKYPQLNAIIDDKTMTPFKKKLAAAPLIKKIVSDIRGEEKTLAAKRESLDLCEAILKASESFPEWQKLPPKLEKNDHSRLHHLATFLQLQDKHMGELRKGADPDDVPWDEITPFVVQHDWAGAFANAGDYAEGGFNLPYARCAFEFRISGRSLTVLAFQEEGCDPSFVHYVQFGDFWVSHEQDDQKDYPAAKFAVEQVKAICVALEAEVATRHIERAPAKLNKKRLAEGKVPLYSYHIVNLNRRYRPANPSAGGGVVKGQKRLHFRRGHWRHYAEFKSWVRWTLVGNPALGFIDKEYRL